MSLVEKMAVSLGRNAKLLINVDEDKEQIIVYGAICLFQILFAISWIIIAGLILGVLYEALIFSIIAAILRKYSGGAHASSPGRCIIMGTTAAMLAGLSIDKAFYTLNLTYVVLMSAIIIIFSFIVVVKKAPVDSINKPITNIEMKKTFRKKSIITIVIFSAIIIIFCILNKMFSELLYIKIVESMALGILWQTITLTSSGISFLNKVDFVLKYMMEGSGFYEE